MAVDKDWPEMRSSIITCSYSAWCSMCIYTTVLSTYLFQLFGNKGGVFPKLGSEALSQDQRVKQSRKNSLGWETEELCQAWLGLTYSESLEQYEILPESTFFMCMYVCFLNLHLLMRIPFLKIFATSWVSPNSWTKMEPSWAWIKLKHNNTYLVIKCMKTQ